MTEIIVAKSAGFCFGVEKAVNRAYKEAKQRDESAISTYGDIIHNNYIIKELESKGVKAIESHNDLDKDVKNRVIIRAHGVPNSVYRELEHNNVDVIDCTCPFVKKIHTIVEDESPNSQIIIVGNGNHPEVIGINGHCNNDAIIINNEVDANNQLFDEKTNYTVVVQTTLNKQHLDNIIKILDDKKVNYKLYNTICAATKTRQQEANEISKKVDIMIVIGDKKSSNSNKLYEICKKNCENTHLIENIYDLSLNNIKNNVIIGITAGASTPQALIKEAINNMSENLNELSFEAMLDASMDKPVRNGQVVKGTVILVNKGEAFVNFGYKADGVIPANEVSSDPNVTAEETFNVGDEIDCLVVKLNDGEGNVILSTKRIANSKNLEVLEEAFNNKSVVTGKIVDIVKGGATALINDVRVFVPMSQISARFTRDINSFKGNEYDFHIIEFDAEKRRIIASRKELAIAEEKEMREKALANINAGDKVNGTVSRITDFGAFIDLGGVDGLVHISELSWNRVKKVADVLSVGDAVEVYVLDADKETGKVSLSLKDAEKDPWKIAEDRLAVGNEVIGTVVRIVDFGAFVDLGDGIDGLVHISQISNEHVRNVNDVLNIGEQISAVVNELDVQNKKISLSMKALEVFEEDAE